MWWGIRGGRRSAAQHMLCWIQIRGGHATPKGRGGPTQGESSPVYLLCGLLSQKLPPSPSWSFLPPHDVPSAVTSLPLCRDKAAVVMCCLANMHAASDQRPGPARSQPGFAASATPSGATHSDAAVTGGRREVWKADAGLITQAEHIRYGATETDLPFSCESPNMSFLFSALDSVLVFYF